MGGRRERAKKTAVVRRARARQRSSRVDRCREAALRFVIAQVACVDHVEDVEREPFVQRGVVGDQRRPRIAEPRHDLRGIRQPVFAMLQEEVDVAARHGFRTRRELTLGLDDLGRVNRAAHDGGLPRDPLQLTNQARPLRRRHVLQDIDRDGHVERGVLEGQRLAGMEQDDGVIVELTDVRANDVEPLGNEHIGQRNRTATDIEQREGAAAFAGQDVSQPREKGVALIDVGLPGQPPVEELVQCDAPGTVRGGRQRRSFAPMTDHMIVQPLRRAAGRDRRFRPRTCSRGSRSRARDWPS